MPTFNPIINSIEELANSETVNALIVKGSTTEEYILVSYFVHRLGNIQEMISDVSDCYTTK